ncbi:retrovirus-related pol polyprotein from transposon TNT 1-94 [Tanacetum coccineum]
MLVENDYESWKIRITQKKIDSEFNDEENKLEMADTQAEIILSQGLPRHIFNILNQTSTAKEIWDNVEMLMQGSGRTLQQRKEDLFDEYERFRAIGNESIHDYFVRFHKLVNDMKITQLEIPTHQMNTKFVNNLPAYWGKYVTNVKQNMDISTTPYVQIYTHLKAYEPHAKKTLKKQEQSTSIVDPLAYVAHTTSAPALSSPSTPSPQPTAQSPNDALMATMTQIANLLSGFQKQFPPTNNQLRTSSNSKTHATVHDGQIVTEPIQRKAPGNVGNTGARGKKVICYNCRGEGHVARQCKEPKRKMDSQYFKDKALLMEAKEKGDVLDAEAEAFLADVECTAPYDQPQALTTTNMFQANHEDAHMINEVHSNDNQIFDNVDYQLSQEMHQKEHLDSDAETEIDDNTISYHQYLLDTKAHNVPTEFVEQQLVPFYDHFKKHIESANETIFKEVKEYEQIFDDLDAEKKISAPIGAYSRFVVPPSSTLPLRRSFEVYSSTQNVLIWVKSTPLPQKKQVTFQEPPKTSNRPTQKPPVQQNKKPNVPVNLSTGPKPATGISQTMPRATLGNLLFFANKIWNATRNHNVNTTKTTWRPIGKVVGSVKPQWKPTGRHFFISDHYIEHTEFEIQEMVNIWVSGEAY